MKKFIAVILTVIYFSTSTGATIHIHYCMGKPAEWGLGQNKSATCKKCGMDKSGELDNGCCKDEHQFIKNNSDQKAAESVSQLFFSTSSALPTTVIELSVSDIPYVSGESPVSNAPPRNNGISVYLLNCFFLI